MYKTVIDLTRKKDGYLECLKAFLSERRNVVHCEYGHPDDATRRLIEVGHQLTLQNFYIRKTLPADINYTQDESRICCYLTEPVFTDTTVTFTIVPFGQMKDILKKQLEKGRQFLVGARFHHFNNKVMAIQNLDLLPEEIHQDTTTPNILEPFIKL